MSFEDGLVPYPSASGNMFGREDAIKSRKCISTPMGCGQQLTKEDMDTWPDITFREYLMSGLCKKCQKSVFNESDECTCATPCCVVDIEVGIVTCSSQHCPVYGDDGR